MEVKFFNKLKAFSKSVNLRIDEILFNLREISQTHKINFKLNLQITILITILSQYL